MLKQLTTDNSDTVFAHAQASQPECGHHQQAHHGESKPSAPHSCATKLNPGGLAAAQNDIRSFAASLLDGTAGVVEEPNDEEDQIGHAEMAHQLNEWFMADRNSRWGYVRSDQLFLGDEAGFDLNDPAWQPDWVPTRAAARAAGNLGAALGGGGFDAAALVARML